MQIAPQASPAVLGLIHLTVSHRRYMVNPACDRHLSRFLDDDTHAKTARSARIPRTSRHWEKPPMPNVQSFAPGGYRFIPGPFQYSGGVAAEPGFRIERARFA